MSEASPRADGAKKKVAAKRVNGSNGHAAGDRVPPHDLDAEAAVLSACLLEPDLIESVREFVAAENFYADANGRIFEALCGVRNAGQPVDLVTVAGWLRDRDRLAQTGGTPYLAMLSDATPAVMHVETHALRVRELAERRLVLSRSIALAASIYARDDLEVERLLSELRADKPAAAPTIELRSLGALVAPALERAERRRTGEDRPVPVPFREWSEALGGGLWSGAHFVVSGTGVGKSQLTIQTALGAAFAGVPCLYIGLELDEAQIALRTIGEHVGVRWSNLYLGRCSESEISRARDGLSVFADLPLYVDVGSPRGWPASRLFVLVEQLRKMHPSGPLLVVLDYLQLVGDDDLPFGRRRDLRERIGDAAYAAHAIANRFDASVVLVSSAARNHYGLLSSDASEAGLVTRNVGGHIEPQRVIAHPHVLMGLGKESGELEYSASTSTVMLRWPEKLDNGETAIVLAVPKVRCGIERWCALAFGGGRFVELPIKSVDELPAITKRRGATTTEAVTPDELDARILSTVRRMPHVKSKTEIAENTTGTKGVLLKRIAALFEAGTLVWAEGVVRAKEPNR